MTVTAFSLPSNSNSYGSICYQRVDIYLCWARLDKPLVKQDVFDELALVYIKNYAAHLLFGWNHWRNQRNS